MERLIDSRTFQVATRLFWSVPARIAWGVAFSLGLGWLAIRGLDWARVAEAFQGFNVWYVVFALVAFNAATVLRAFRWQVLFLEERVPLWRLFLVQNTGIGLNNLSPVRVVSEPVQFAMLTLRYRAHGGVTAASLGMERVLDMVASTALLAAALLFLPARGALPVYLLAAFVIAAIAVTLMVVSARAGRWSFVKRIPALSSFSTAVAELGRARKVLAYSLFLSIVYWMAVGTCAWVVSLGMEELHISPLVATLAVLGTLYLTTSIPSLPMAIGTFEAAIRYVLAEVFGADEAVAFSYAVIVHAMLYLPPTLIAVVGVLTIGIRPSRLMEEGVAATKADSEIREREDIP